jgi:hypothetical protein
VSQVEQHALEPDEQLIGLVLDNSATIETGGRAPGGARHSGDKTAQRLARQQGFDLEQRVPCGVLALTDLRRRRRSHLGLALKIAIHAGGRRSGLAAPWS